MASEARTYAGTLALHDEALIDLLGRLPESTASWAPWEGAMTTLQLGDHIYMVDELMVASVVGRDPELKPEPSKSLAELRENFMVASRRHHEELGRLTPEDFERPISFMGREMAVRDLLLSLIAHEAHHKGQMFVYARIQGVEPPFYIKMG